jgi:transcriptional regulator with XRE-family HTH domain
MTQTAIAKLSGLSDATVSYILSGKRSPRRLTALRLEKATGVSRHIWRDGDPAAIRAALAGSVPQKPPPEK